jgi:hypothetical protein
MREQIDSWLPAGYSTENAPHIDIESLSGRSGGWLTEDPHCCPSRLVAFTLTLLKNEIRLKDIRFVTE